MPTAMHQSDLAHLLLGPSHVRRCSSHCASGSATGRVPLQRSCLQHTPGASWHCVVLRPIHARHHHGLLGDMPVTRSDTPSSACRVTGRAPSQQSRLRRTQATCWEASCGSASLSLWPPPWVWLPLPRTCPSPLPRPAQVIHQRTSCPSLGA